MAKYPKKHINLEEEFEILRLGMNPFLSIKAKGTLKRNWGAAPHRLFEFKRDNKHLCIAANIHLPESHKKDGENPVGHMVQGQQRSHTWHQMSITESEADSRELIILWNRDVDGTNLPLGCDPGEIDSTPGPDHGGRAHATGS
jgi:hypothetical protein